jgi:hypothetical protein
VVINHISVVLEKIVVWVRVFKLTYNYFVCRASNLGELEMPDIERSGCALQLR